MARKEPPPPHDRIASPDSLRLHESVDHWLKKIRDRLSENATVAATVRRLSRKRFLVTFRAAANGETFISEARKEKLEEAVSEAGSWLWERLSASPPSPQKKLGDKIRRLFREAS